MLKIFSARPHFPRPTYTDRLISTPPDLPGRRRVRSAGTPVLPKVLWIYFLFLTAVVTLSPFRMEWPNQWHFSREFGRFDFVANFFLFLPIGFLFQAGFPGRTSKDWWRPILIVLLLSVAIELLQMCSPGRQANAWDVAANSLGGCAGAFIQSMTGRGARRRMPDRLLFELPLVSLFFLLSPLLWMNAFASEWEPDRLWLSAILGVAGGTILVAAWQYWPDRDRPWSVEGAAAALITWFLACSLPALLHHPTRTMLGGVTTLLAGVFQLTVWPVAVRSDRRFEQPTLRRFIPLFGLFLLALAFWPFEPLTRSWQFRLGLPSFPDRPSARVILGLLEYVTAFTIVGYVWAEREGRLRRTTSEALGSALLGSILLAALLEGGRGFHPENRASLTVFLLASASGGFGGLIYRVQLGAVRDLLAQRPVGSMARSPAGEAAMSSKAAVP